mmetsp:Transcript_2453/g.3394  ORF Transcript_2453/g.3394 Transcript_2453/m.3394 type:complete len:98 (+) Transcript_2453:185-478(+)
MTYLGVKSDYRSATFVSSLMMAFGLILMILSLETANMLVCLLAVSLLTPSVMNVVFHQVSFYRWPMKRTSSSESINWIVELLMLASVLTCLTLVSLW